MITSRENATLTLVRKLLRGRKHREETGLFAAEGEDLVAAAQAAGVEPVYLLVAGETVDAGRVEAAARRARPWRVRLDGVEASDARPQVAAALRLAPESITVDRRDVVVEISSDEDAVAALRELVAAGLAVVEFAAAQGSLERTFLDLGRGVPPQEAAARPGPPTPPAAGGEPTNDEGATA